VNEGQEITGLALISNELLIVSCTSSLKLFSIKREQVLHTIHLADPSIQFIKSNGQFLIAGTEKGLQLFEFIQVSPFSPFPFLTPMSE